jgi:DNA-directed RNA polymerase subunit H (RpoH/RPB5)
VLIELLENQRYQCEDVKGFSIQDIEVKYENSQLDMLVSKEDSSSKIYVKYFLNKTSTLKNNLDEIIDDIFDNHLQRQTDSLVVILEEEPNDTIRDKVKYLFDKLNTHVILFNIKRLQFNVLKHEKNPSQLKILTGEEKKDFMELYNIDEESQIPVVDRFNILAMCIFIRPHEVCEIVRKNPVSVRSIMYRVCV